MEHKPSQRVPTNWIGFQGKTLWDWIQLLIIPSLLGTGALVFNDRNAQTQLALSTNSQQETALQAYINDMSALLLDKGLSTSSSASDVRNVARIRTLSVLQNINAVRKRTVFQFLQETKLISGPTPVVLLVFADLSGVNLIHARLAGDDLMGTLLSSATLTDADLTGANLANTDLTGANFTQANLTNAILTRANLTGANLTTATLTNADLTNAILTNAQVTAQQLAQAKSLKGATLPNGTKHE